MYCSVRTNNGKCVSDCFRGAGGKVSILPCLSHGQIEVVLVIVNPRIVELHVICCRSAGWTDVSDVNRYGYVRVVRRSQRRRDLSVSQNCGK